MVIKMWSKPRQFVIDTSMQAYKESPSQKTTLCAIPSSNRSKTGWMKGTWEYGLYRVYPPSSEITEGYAHWMFEDIPSGFYEVLVSYISHDNRSHHVRYRVLDGDIPSGEAVISQAGVNGVRHWKSLGDYLLMYGDIRITVLSSQDGYVVADFIKLIEKKI